MAICAPVEICGSYPGGTVDTMVSTVCRAVQLGVKVASRASSFRRMQYSVSAADLGRLLLQSKSIATEQNKRCLFH